MGMVIEDVSVCCRRDISFYSVNTYKKLWHQTEIASRSQLPALFPPLSLISWAAYRRHHLPPALEEGGRGW